MKATMTILGLSSYDPNLFDLLVLPDGVDHDLAIFHICEECGFLEVLFPRPDYMRESIGAWSRGMLEGWKRFWTAIHESYDPLHNYDRTEIVHEKTAATGNATAAKTGYDSGAFQDTDKSVSDSTGDRDMETRVYGNIGVTTSQAMLTAELNVTRELNFYKHLAHEFKDKFCVAVY